MRPSIHGGHLQYRPHKVAYHDAKEYRITIWLEQVLQRISEGVILAKSKCLMAWLRWPCLWDEYVFSYELIQNTWFLWITFYFFLDETRSIWKLIFLDKIHLGVFKLMHWVILGENLILVYFEGHMCHGRTFTERSLSTMSESLLQNRGMTTPSKKIFFFEKYMVWPVYICYQIMFRCLGSLVLPWGLFFGRTFNLNSIAIKII